VIDEDENSFTTLSLNDDPEPAARRAIQRASEQKKFAPVATAIGGIGLAVFLVLLYDAYSDYVTHTRETSGLVSRGRRIPAQLSGEPVQEGIRSSLAPLSWRVEYSYPVDGRRYSGIAYMRVRPESVVVVFDPRYPAAHRVDGALEYSNLDGRRMMAYGAGAAACGLIFFIGGLTAWTSNRTG